MTRFACIGDRCEENCCEDGWRIDVNREGYRRLITAAQFAPRDIAKRVQAAIRVVPPKDRKQPETYLIRLNAAGACPLFEDGWCAIQSNLGADMLPHVCAIYPRKLYRITDRYELSATASCPEITRQILLYEDAVDTVPLDLTTLNRVVLQESMDARDLRPFLRAMGDVRDAMMALACDASIPVDARQFLTLWFAKRTSDILSRSRASGDLAPVDRELAMIHNPHARAEILKRFKMIETPAAVAVYIARGIVRPRTEGLRRPRWEDLVKTLIASFAPLATILPDSQDSADHDRAALSPLDQGANASAHEVFEIYAARRDRLRAIPAVAARIDQFFRNYMVHTWFHRAPTEEFDLLNYVLRMFAQQACQKFMLYGHPSLQTALDDYAAAEDHDAALKELIETVDAVGVDCFYQLARHIEHGGLIKWLVKYLEDRGLASIAGGIHLIHF